MKLPNDFPPVIVKAAKGEPLTPTQRDELASLLKQTRQTLQPVKRVPKVKRPKRRRKTGILRNVLDDEVITPPPRPIRIVSAKTIFAIGDDPEFCEVMEQRRFATRDGIDALITWRMEWEEKFLSSEWADKVSDDFLELWNVAGRLMDLYNIERKMP
jgi:hypothetical protein